MNKGKRTNQEEEQEQIKKIGLMSGEVEKIK